MGVADDAVLLAFVSQQFRQKGLGYLIEALARAERPLPPGRLALAVIGRDEAEAYQAQAARLGLRSPVHYLGQVDRERVWSHYAAADAVVLPTVFDACSRTVLEALAMGTPAITTEHNGAGEPVDQHAAGEVVHSAWAVEELAGAIGRAADPAVHAKWSAAAALSDYVSIRRMTDELVGVYEELLAGRSPAGRAASGSSRVRR